MEDGGDSFLPLCQVSSYLRHAAGQSIELDDSRTIQENMDGDNLRRTGRQVPTRLHPPNNNAIDNQLNDQPERGGLVGRVSDFGGELPT